MTKEIEKKIKESLKKVEIFIIKWISLIVLFYL